MSKNLVITTTHRPSEIARSVGRLIAHIVPNADYVTRGSLNEDELSEKASEVNANTLIILQSKGNLVSRLEVKKRINNKFVKDERALEFKQIIDHKVFGWKNLPFRGPMSISSQVRNKHPEIVSFFEDYFKLQVGTKEDVWLFIDEKANSHFIELVDAMTQDKILFAEIKLIKGGKEHD